MLFSSAEFKTRGNGYQIDGDPSVNGAIVMTDDTKATIAAYPPTVESIAVADEFGFSLGYAMGIYDNDPVRTSMSVCDGLRIPTNTTMERVVPAAQKGLLDYAEDLKLFGGILKIASFEKEHRGEIDAEIERRKALLEGKIRTTIRQALETIGEKDV